MRATRLICVTIKSLITRYTHTQKRASWVAGGLSVSSSKRGASSLYDTWFLAHHLFHHQRSRRRLCRVLHLRLRAHVPDLRSSSAASANPTSASESMLSALNNLLTPRGEERQLQAAIQIQSAERRRHARRQRRYLQTMKQLSKFSGRATLAPKITSEQPRL